MAPSPHLQRPEPSAYCFGPFRLRVRDRLLEKDNQRIPLTPKVIDTLFVLIERHGQVVTKEELTKAVWPDVTVVESGLTRNVSVLRKALEADGTEGAYLETIPKLGYRFVAPVIEEREPAGGELLPDAIPQPATRHRIPRWLWALALTAATGLIALGLLYRGRAQHATPVEPLVRIGEHLLYKLSPGEMERAVVYFEQAIAANPNSSSAHAGLAITLLGLIDFGARTNENSGEMAVSAARKAVKLAPVSCLAHTALAFALLVHEWNLSTAETEFRRALRYDPGSVQTRLIYARLKEATGRLIEARQVLEEALALDPASPALGTAYCRIHYDLRDFQRAESECRKVLDRERGSALANYYLALSLGLLGRTAEAKIALRNSGLRPEVLQADDAWLTLLDGDPRAAEAVLESRRLLMRAGKVNASAKLLPASILGRIDEAGEALDAIWANRSPEILSIAVEPRLDPIRSHPRYQELVRRFGLCGAGIQPDPSVARVTCGEVR